MKKILLINSGIKIGESKGNLNSTMQILAKEYFLSRSFEVLETHIQNGYDVQEEVQKMISADVIIWQFPVWWMTIPWNLKKYVDEVFTGCYGKLYENDGRTRKDPSKKYGSGGIDFNKKYMFCSTWNAPSDVFSNKETFFEGKTFDDVFIWFHKAHQFMGLKPLKSFMLHDVVKNPNVEKFLNDYQSHLKNVFEK